MKYFMILLLVLLTSCSSSALLDFNDRIERLKESNPVPILSREQMYNDFDTLINTILLYNPQIKFRNEITGSNMIDEMRSLRGRVDSIKTSRGFIMLLKNVLSLAQDGHCKHAAILYFYRNNIYKKEVKRIKANENTFGINFNYSIVKTSKMLSFKLVYKDGKYYNLNPITFFYNDKNLIIPSGREIVSLNQIELNSFVKANKDLQDYIGWDFIRKQYFIHQKLYVPLDFKNKSIGIKYNGEIESFSIDSVVDINNYNLPWDKAVTHYFGEDSVLYIRLPQMSPILVKRLRKEILKHKKEDINSVVIDIRGNKGGDDITWIRLLKCIIKDPIIRQVKLAVNKGIAKQNKKQENIKYLSNDNDEVSFSVAYDFKEKIKPYWNSLKFNGKTYIMMDENIFSSSGALISTASRETKLVTIGRRTGIFMGQGLSPDVFILPESKFCFYIEKYIDFTNGIDKENIFNDKPKVSLNLPIEYYVKRENSKIDIYSKKYLFNEDLFFKNVLSYIRDRKKIRNN